MTDHSHDRLLIIDFGSQVTQLIARRVREAVRILNRDHPELRADGEMHADVAVMGDISDKSVPDCRVMGQANVLVFPDLQSANIAYKLLWRLGGVEAIGPILTGIGAPVYVLQRGVEVQDIVNMAAICVLKAQRFGVTHPEGGQE